MLSAQYRIAADCFQYIQIVQQCMALCLGYGADEQCDRSISVRPDAACTLLADQYQASHQLSLFLRRFSAAFYRRNPFQLPHCTYAAKQTAQPQGISFQD